MITDGQTDCFTLCTCARGQVINRLCLERKLELSVYQGCILWGSRVVIPEDYREHVLYQLHEGHPGVARMKNLARMYGCMDVCMFGGQ